MNSKKHIIEFNRFTDKKSTRNDFRIALGFLVIFLIVGLIEKNWILPNEGLGLLQHKNIWIFLLINLISPLVISKTIKALECNIDAITFENLKNLFSENANLKAIVALQHFAQAIGFCCFVGNSLQNAHIINQLPFDYWDSINYILSYIISRIYKLYLFSYFIPDVLIYIFILLKSVSKLTALSESEMEKYPAKNYEQANVLCNFGLNLLMLIMIPFIASSIAVYLIHDRFDITTITTIVISVVCAVVSLCVYIYLIKNFYFSVSKYKKTNIEKINSELNEIHQYILSYTYDENKEKLEVYLKREEYLCQVKSKIDGLSRFPHIVKAFFTSISPIIPSLLKVAFHF